MSQAVQLETAAYAGALRGGFWGNPDWPTSRRNFTVLMKRLVRAAARTANDLLAKEVAEQGAQ
ncbi:MAG: hypothetical protein JNJ54_27485 [Myxococcaceae bacterium]|nr:hypothetical protein [Myxococcaceae bacterium]